MKKYQSFSHVEQTALQQSNMQEIYPPTEKVRSIIVENFPALGKLTALRFIEWAQKNEGWTVSLPTGKTPEHFIKWVNYILNNWKNKKVKNLLKKYDIDYTHIPNMRSFHFIQIDEFYPINSMQHNSFYYYVNKFYIKLFGFDRGKALLIDPNKIGLKPGESLDDIWPERRVDISLRTRYPKSHLEERQKQTLEAVDQFCTDYETKIQELGGIGFFLGGIGPDGHIGFNVRGSDHFSTTRLTPTNYETQAAAATDLGGIEVSRNRLVITVGLKTITRNPETTAIIIAAGEAKAGVIKDAIESERSNLAPASCLHDLKNACFIITKGAAKLLTERRFLFLSQNEKISAHDKHQIIADLAMEKKKKLSELTIEDFHSIRPAKLLLQKTAKDYKTLIVETEKLFLKRIRKGLQAPQNKTILHTAPHHDDIMLGYLAYIVRLIREGTNRHYFNYLTSGFTAVTNAFMYEEVQNARHFLQTAQCKALIKENYFDPLNEQFRNRDVYQYLDGIAASDREAMREGCARRFLRNLVETFEDDSFDNLEFRIGELHNYFYTQYSGKKDLPYIQRLKGMTREWEADILWGYFGFNASSVWHSRLGFYKGDIFTEEPSINRDALPILENLKRAKPDIVTLAFDPEGSGPDTHYKVLQAVAEALKLYEQESGRSDIEVWGYRNVWYRFHPSEADIYVPVTNNTRAILNDAFMYAFGSQSKASFPSYEYDGPFSELAQKIQAQQYQMMKTMLGGDYFYNNADSRIRSTRGFAFLKIMNLKEFYAQSLQLRKYMENAPDF